MVTRAARPTARRPSSSASRAARSLRSPNHAGRLERAEPAPARARRFASRLPGPLLPSRSGIVDLDGVEIVRQPVEHGSPRFRDGEEACESEILQPGEVRPELDHPSDRFPVAAEGHGIEPLSLRLEDSRRDLAGCLEGHAGLLVAPPAEPVRRRAAGAVPAMDEPLTDLRGDYSVA